MPISLTHLVDRFWALAPDPEGGLGLEATHLAARTLVRAYYLGQLLIAFQHLALWNHYVGLRSIRPLWPVFWASGDSGRDAMLILLLFAAGSCAAAFFPDHIAARAAAFFGCLEFSAFVSSFGTVRHVHHLMLLTSFLFVLIPVRSGRAARDEDRRAYLRGVWGVQCAALLTYSMAGFVKLMTGAWHLATGQGGVLTPAAMALHVANSGIRFGIDAPLADLAIRARILGLPIYLVVLYLELFALPIAFRPRLHRPWGVALVLMHLGISLTLNLFFLSSLFIVGLLLLASPFAPATPGWRAAAGELPLLGRFVRRFAPAPASL